MAATRPHRATAERWFETFESWDPDRRAKSIFAAQQVHEALLRIERTSARIVEPESPESDMEQARRRAPLPLIPEREPECDCRLMGDMADASECAAHGPNAPTPAPIVAELSEQECPFA